MVIIISTLFHKINGSHDIVKYNDFNGLKFNSEKELRDFKKEKIKEVLGYYNAEIHDMDADFLFTTVELPDQTTSLPENWKPQPFEKPVRIEPEPKTDYESIPAFVSRKPRMSIHQNHNDE